MTKFYTNVRQYGDNILYLGYDANGNRVQKKEKYQPTLYINSQDDTKDSECYDGTPLRKVKHDSIKDAKEFINTYKGVHGFNLYGMDKFNYQYISEHFPTEVEYDTQKMKIFYFDIEVDSSNGFPDPFEAKEEITSISLEDVNAKEMHVWVVNGRWGGDFDPDNLKHIKKGDFNWKLITHAFTNEKDMLRDFLAFYSGSHPDVLSGWYSRHFDVPYLYNRLRNVIGDKAAKRLSPWNIIREQTKQVKKFGTYREEKTYDIFGTSELDYQDLYRKYTFVKSPSYSLDYITKKHLGVGKLKYDGTLTDLLTTDYQTYVEYNIIDTGRISQLEEALRFLELIIDVSYSGKVAMFTDALGTVKYWEMLIYNHLCEKGQQPPLKVQGGVAKNDQYAGAFVKEPKVGKHKWIVSFDLASLYPSIIRQVNIGPETKIDLKTIPENIRRKLEDLPVVIYPPTGKDTCNDAYIDKSADLSFLDKKSFDYSLSGNSKLYSKEHQSFLSELMEKFFAKRKIYKKKMQEAEQAYIDTGDEKYKRLQIIYGVKQLATKILINSAYGAVGNAYFQYYDLDNAEAVTITGQLVIRWIELRTNFYLNSLFKELDDKERIVYMDTDSMYICLEDLVNKIMPGETDNDKIVNFLDNVCKKKLEPFINKCYEELFEYLNNRESLMVMDREAISNVAVWTGKKRYFMNVQDNEGVRYDPPKFKVMGIEVVKSSTPQVCRDALDKALRILLNEDEETLIEFIAEFKRKFKQMPVEDISFPRGTNELDKWIDENDNIKSGCPIHVRGALVYNKAIKDNNLTNTHDLIKEGESVYFTYLRIPNTLHEHVFAFLTEVPKELDIQKYIDYDTQFDKAFLQPLISITDIIGWKTEKTNDLSSLFF